MALREERPADFTDEERWGVHWLSTPALVAALSLITVSAGICKACAAIHILPLGILVSILLIVPGTVLFILPVPEGDIWHGQGTLIAKILMRVIVHAKTSKIYVRHLSRMGEDIEISESNVRNKRRTGKKRKRASGEKA